MSEKTEVSVTNDVTSDVTRHVGMRIREYRKTRGLSMEELSGRIGKSKATLSKYERGMIAIDVATLFSIAQVLGTDLKSLTDYSPAPVPPDVLPKGFYFNKPELYVYFYDGRIKRVVRSLLRITAPPTEQNECPVILYDGVTSFDKPEKCLYLLAGTLRSYDTITHVLLTNRVNPTEQMYLCILNPLHANAPAVGMLAGIGSNPFFAPVAIKLLVSTEILEENEDFMNVLQFSKMDSRLLRYYNMMVINRPGSMFLDVKK